MKLFFTTIFTWLSDFGIWIIRYPMQFITIIAIAIIIPLIYKLLRKL